MSTPGRSASYNAPPGPLSGWSDLWLAATRIRPGLIIIDPALSAFSGESNAAAPVREFLGALALRAKTLGTGVLLTAHSNKSARGGVQDPYDPRPGGRQRGLGGWCQGCYGYDPPSAGRMADEGTATSELHLAVAKSNYGPSLAHHGLEFDTCRRGCHRWVQGRRCLDRSWYELFPAAIHAPESGQEICFHLGLIQG